MLVFSSSRTAGDVGPYNISTNIVGSRLLAFSYLRTVVDACPYNVSANIERSRFVVNFKPCNEVQGVGDKIIGTVVVLARKTVPIVLYPDHVSGREIYADLRTFFK